MSTDSKFTDDADDVHPDDRLALHVATGASLRTAAKVVGVSYATARRRAAEPDFKTRVNEIRAALFEETTGRLITSMRTAANTLTRLMHSKSERIQLAACKIIIESATQLRQLTEFEQRLSELEGRTK